MEGALKLTKPLKLTANLVNVKMDPCGDAYPKYFIIRKHLVAKFFKNHSVWRSFY